MPKMFSRGVGTISTIENFILGTCIFWGSSLGSVFLLSFQDLGLHAGIIPIRGHSLPSAYYAGPALKGKYLGNIIAQCFCYFYFLLFRRFAFSLHGTWEPLDMLQIYAMGPLTVSNTSEFIPRTVI